MIWILISDQFVEGLTQDPQVILKMETYKGWFFVTISAGLIFALQLHYHKSLSQKLAELKNANQDLQLFFYKASHDLRGPIKSILGLSNLIKGSKAGSELDEITKHINQSARKADHMIYSLEQLSSVLEGDLQYSDVDFRSIIQENIRRQNLRLTELPEKVQYVDKVQLTRKYLSHPYLIDLILEKVLENAIQFSAPFRTDPKIEIVVEEITNGILLKVQDNGTGIEHHQLQDIFEMFYRGTANSEGAGLGLYVAKLAVEKLNGKIWACSERGIGTTVSMWLPAI